MAQESGWQTRCVHAAREAEAATGAVAQPIYLSTTFERGADGGYPRGYRYSREATPNRTALEACVAQLEGGIGALAFTSGLAASMAILDQLSAGDHLIGARSSYYGTLRQFHELATRRGIQLSVVDCTDLAQVHAALRPQTRLVWIETPANPLLAVTDIAQVCEIAHSHGAQVLCDSTFATPVCQRPFELGADVIVHSGTKYFGGHSDVLSGLLVVRQDAALLERLSSWQSMSGATLAPFDCWLLRRSIATLALRVRTQCANALRVAQFLAGHARIEQVYYPGLPAHPGHRLACTQMPGGFGAVLSACVRGGTAEAMEVCARVRLFTRATSLGGVESLIEHRASIEGPGTKVAPNLLRLSIGIEDADDLIADLAQALQVA
jgi:cystathionine gamma-synthase